MMFAWMALDRITRAWYEPYENAFGKSYVACFVGPEYTWQGSKYVSCKTEEKAAEAVQSFYEQFCQLKREHDKHRPVFKKQASPLQG